MSGTPRLFSMSTRTILWQAWTPLPRPSRRKKACPAPRRCSCSTTWRDSPTSPMRTWVTPYGDVEVNEWYTNAIYWARLTGVAVGDDEGNFRPNATISRQEFAQMLYNYAEYKKYDLTGSADLSGFSDAGSISSWAETAMKWANANGLINGHADTLEIDPTGGHLPGAGRQHHEELRLERGGINRKKGRLPAGSLFFFARASGQLFQGEIQPVLRKADGKALFPVITANGVQGGLGHGFRQAAGAGGAPGRRCGGFYRQCDTGCPSPPAGDSAPPDLQSQGSPCPCFSFLST